MAGRATSASQKAIRSERQLRLQAVINELPEGQREAVQLRYLEGLKVGEIAKQMDRSEEAVAGLLKRGLSAIKDRIGNESM